MDFKARITELGLPLDKTVVIGGGLLDQLGLREANDLDLAVASEVFAELGSDERFEYVKKYGDDCYELGDAVEIWGGWSELTWAELKRDAVELDGVFFINPEQLAVKKRERGTEKDLNDIQKLEEYYARKF